jgi:hypothetical protein
MRPSAVRSGALALALAGLLSCAAPDPAGSYAMSSSRTSGTCPDDRQAPRTVIVDTSNTIRFLGVPGGCPLEEVDDAWIGKCDLAGGGLAASYLWRLTFTDAGFWGTSREAYFSKDGLLCVGEYAVTGTRER